MESQLWFWLMFFQWLRMLSIFTRAYQLHVYPLWRNVYSSLLPIFKKLIICFWISLNGRWLLCILYIKLFYDTWLANTVFHSIGCLFPVLIMCPEVFMSSSLSIFPFFACAFRAISKKSLPKSMSWNIPYMFSSKNFLNLILIIYKTIFLYFYLYLNCINYLRLIFEQHIYE